MSLIFVVVVAVVVTLVGRSRSELFPEPPKLKSDNPLNSEYLQLVKMPDFILDTKSSLILSDSKTIAIIHT